MISKRFFKSIRQSLWLLLMSIAGLAPILSCSAFAYTDPYGYVYTDSLVYGGGKTEVMSKGYADSRAAQLRDELLDKTARWVAKKLKNMGLPESAINIVGQYQLRDWYWENLWAMPTGGTSVDAAWYGEVWITLESKRSDLSFKVLKGNFGFPTLQQAQTYCDQAFLETKKPYALMSYVSGPNQCGGKKSPSSRYCCDVYLEDIAYSK